MFFLSLEIVSCSFDCLCLDCFICILELRKSEFICMTLIRKDIFLERVGICYVLLLHLIVFVLIVTGIQFLLKEYLTYEFLGWICVRERLILEIITCHNHILTTNPYYFYPMWDFNHFFLGGLGLNHFTN